MVGFAAEGQGRRRLCVAGGRGGRVGPGADRAQGAHGQLFRAAGEAAYGVLADGGSGALAAGDNARCAARSTGNTKRFSSLR